MLTAAYQATCERGKNTNTAASTHVSPGTTIPALAERQGNLHCMDIAHAAFKHLLQPATGEQLGSKEQQGPAREAGFLLE